MKLTSSVILESEKVSQYDFAVRRFLEDLRSGADRRHEDDRREFGGLHRQDRRSGTERRGLGNRRTHEFGVFSAEQIAVITTMMADTRRNAACPTCGGRLLVVYARRTNDRGPSIICTGCRSRVTLAAGIGS